MAKPIDTLLAYCVDTHCGSTLGLIPPNWQLEEGGTHILSRPQQIRWDWHVETWREIGRQRKKKRLIIAGLGDLIDGVHHSTTELLTTNTDEQVSMAIEVLHVAMDLAKFGRGDLLFVAEGTEVHTRGLEGRIGRDLGAVPFIPPSTANNYDDMTDRERRREDGKYAHPELRLEINGQVFWMAHHALQVGAKAWTRENPLLSSLRDIYFDCLEYGRAIPNWVVGAHYHIPTQGGFARNGHTMNGMVLPPMQNRTRFGRRASPNKPTRMGIAYQIVEGDGRVTTHTNLIPAYHQEEIGVIKL